MKDGKLRKMGIEVIGDAPWGTHFCLFYQTKEDLMDILVPYFKAGLENNEFCMWVTSEPLSVEDAERALQRVVKNLDDYIEKGQMEILDYTQWYTKSGRFDADEVLQGWVEKESQAVKRGFEGLRLTGNTFWLEQRDWQAFTNYEAEIDRVIGQYRMLALCTYSLDRCRASEVIDVVSNHEFALIKREGKWETIESARRKRAEEALRESEERFRRLAENAQDIIFRYRFTPTPGFEYVSPAATDITGYTPEEHYADPDLGLKIVHPDDRPQLEKYFQGEGVFIQPIVLRWMKKDGTVIWTEQRNVPIYDQAGDLVALEGIARDITERKRAEEALRVSEERFALAVRGSNAGLWDWDIRDNSLYWSPRLKELLGYADDELDIDFDTFESHLHPDDRERTATAIEAHLKDRELYQVEQRLRTKSGEYRWFLARGQALWDENGNPLRMVGSTTDITDRKRAEEEVRRNLERIEALREIDIAITSTLDLTEVLDIILEELERVIPYHSAGIFLFSNDTARLAAGRGFPDMERALQVSFPIEEDALTCDLLREKRPLGLADAQADERFLARGGTEYVRSWIGVPLIAKGEATGFLSIDHREPGIYGEERAEMAQTFASQAAIAIENARPYEDAQRELAERKRAEAALRQSHAMLQRALEGTVHALASAVELRDPYTAGHQRQVARLACAIATEMDLDEERIEGLRLAALIHDMGKITIPTEVLSKPGELNNFEWGLIKAHPQIGHNLLKDLDFPWPLADIVLQHHERLDGSGYPQGLSGEEITLEARILAIADVVEAMASHRPYRPARGLDEALEEISQNRGRLYDAEAVDACLKLFTEKGFTLE